MISAIYASLSAFLITWLSLNVIKVRRKNEIRYGDGGNKELEIARSAQFNATEYIPIALLLLFSLDYNEANNWVIHVFGIALIVGRVIHARAFLSGKMKGRVLGMQITLFTIVSLAIANFIYLPYGRLFTL